MEIQYHGKKRKDYIKFVIEGLENYQLCNDYILRIDVFNSSISVTYDIEPMHITGLLKCHEHISGYGLDPFISNNAMKNGQRISYKLED
jgi:hypothetical protein